MRGASNRDGKTRRTWAWGAALLGARLLAGSRRRSKGRSPAPPPPEPEPATRKRKAGIGALIKETFKSWSAERAPELAAALAYYTTFSVGPLLFLAIVVAGLVFGQETVRQAVMQQVGGMAGSGAADMVGTMVEGAARQGQSGNGLVTALGFAALALGATGVFGQLQSSLNKVWRVEKRPGAGILSKLKDRFLSLTLVVGIGFLLAVSLLLSTALHAVEGYAGGLAAGRVVALVLSNLVSLAVFTLLFALMFKVLPDADVRWRDLWLGAGITAALFLVGKFALGLYLGQSAMGSRYGAAGSLVIFLVWVYYASQILLLGAEFTRVWAERRGGSVRPDEDARRVRHVKAVAG